MSLLRQDVRLPESSVHDFGRDLVVALQYLHHNSIIYCDLKPSNILLDENGRLKLGGFGLSRRLSDINKTPLQSLPPVRPAAARWGQPAQRASRTPQARGRASTPRSRLGPRAPTPARTHTRTRAGQARHALLHGARAVL